MSGALAPTGPAFPPPATQATPRGYLEEVGSIFATFDRQDSGNISYGVRVHGGRYFVKTAGHPDDGAPGHGASWPRHDQRVAILRNAVRLGQTYRHPALPLLHGAVESPHGPMLVYDWAPGELLHSPGDLRRDPMSASARFRALPTGRILACLDTIVEVHDLLGRSGEVAGDFYDGCLLYDFASHRVHLIDLDGYRRGSYRNDMGRMFGSSRFMAPEEFVLGAVIDARTTVFTLGRTVRVLLSGNGDGADGFRGAQPLLDVAVRACRARPEERFGSLREFCAAWRDARSRTRAEADAE